MRAERRRPTSSSILAENNRKTGSCPVLFTWNGERFVCLGDFLGGGGLGYLVAPGVYSQPDRDEAVAIAADQLRAEQGVFRLSVTEPMDEVAYLDHLTLDVVDRPPGVSATPDERFAPTGPRPTGELLAWRTTIEPVRATDLDGRDMTETLRRWDRRTVDTLPQAATAGSATPRSTGSSSTSATGCRGSARATRWSSAWPAGSSTPTRRPTTPRRRPASRSSPRRSSGRRDDGTWELIEPHAGYPAGLPRLTTLDLTGKLDRPALRAADQDQHGMLL